MNDFSLIQNTLFSTAKTYAEADIVITGFPYEGSLSGMKGTFHAPEVIYEYSYNIEEYSPYQKKSIEDINTCVVKSPMIPYDKGNYKKCLDIIYNHADRIINDGKKLLSIGGEHSITFPLFKRHYEKYNGNTALIHFDAHTDLRDKYYSYDDDIMTEYSHASVIKRIYNELNFDNIYQLGIRSGTQEEFEFAEKYLNICPFNTEKMDDYLKKIGKETPIYLSIDLDVLDPKDFGGVGTPEPLGISYKTLHESIMKLKGYNISGIDVVEYSPSQDPSRSSVHTAIHLIRELLLIF